MRLVLDTNIVMDMLHFANLHTAPLLAALAAGRYQCFTDEACLAELERVVSTLLASSTGLGRNS